MRCFECLQELGHPEYLFTHLKKQHKTLSNDYKCNLCLDVSEDLGSFKKHARKCFEKRQGRVETETDLNTELIDEAFEICNDLAMECSEEISEFKKLLEKTALELVVKMSANMSIPRNLVFKTILNFETFMGILIDGMKTIITPCISLERKNTVKHFLKTIQEPFKKFNTESKLDSELSRADLMQPIQECLLLKDQVTPKKKRRKRDEDEEVVEEEVEEGSMLLMPLSFQIRKFFELPGVFEKIQSHTNTIREANKMNHFINGELWKEKLKNYDKDETVIPYFLYVDGAQINNALGSHHAVGEEQFNYMTFPTIPPQYQSRLENIIVVSICPQIYVKYGIECVFCNVIEELKKLANEGIVLTINGQEKKVYFVNGTFLGDNKESNIYLGFVRGFRGIRYCRFCRMHRKDMEKATIEIDAERRNKQNYTADVLKNKETETGVREYSCLNEIPFFHVTDSSSEDITHNVDLGGLQYNLSGALATFIFEQGDFTLKELNKRIKMFDWNDEERQNIPIPILEKTLNKELKFQMTAAEMSNFAHNITFIIGDLVNEGDITWDFVLNTVRFFDLCYLPCYTDDDINELRDVTDSMHKFYVNLLKKTLKPVHHFAIHYPKDTRKLGPIRYLRTIRCEAKHKAMKNYAKNTTNRIKICYSIGKKVQYNFAHRLMENKGLEDIITVKIRSSASITSTVYYGKLEQSVYNEYISQHICHFTKKAEINGMVFEVGLWLPAVPDDGNCEVKTINEICDILLLKHNSINDIFAVCKTYKSVEKFAHYGSYVVNLDSMQEYFSVIKISEYLEKHHYPVKVHNINVSVCPFATTLLLQSVINSTVTSPSPILLE